MPRPRSPTPTRSTCATCARWSSAADDVAREESARDLAARAARRPRRPRVDEEHEAWLAEIGTALQEGRVGAGPAASAPARPRPASASPPSGRPPGRGRRGAPHPRGLRRALDRRARRPGLLAGAHLRGAGRGPAMVPPELSRSRDPAGRHVCRRSPACSAPSRPRPGGAGPVAPVVPVAHLARRPAPSPVGSPEATPAEASSDSGEQAEATPAADEATADTPSTVDEPTAAEPTEAEEPTAVDVDHRRGRRPTAVDRRGADRRGAEPTAAEEPTAVDVTTDTGDSAPRWRAGRPGAPTSRPPRSARTWPTWRSRLGGGGARHGGRRHARPGRGRRWRRPASRPPTTTPVRRWRAGPTRADPGAAYTIVRMTPCSCRNSASPSTSSQLGDVVEGHPRHLGGVVAGDRRHRGPAPRPRSRGSRSGGRRRCARPSRRARRTRPRAPSPRPAPARRPRPASRRARPAHPGTDHGRPAAAVPRRTSSSRSSSTATAPTHTSGRTAHASPSAPVVVGEGPVHDDGPGGEAEALEEVLGGPVAGQGHGIDAAAAPLPRHQAHDLVHQGLAHTHPARPRPPRRGRRSRPAACRRAAARPCRGVADDDAVDGADQHEVIGVGRRPSRACVGGQRARLAGRATARPRCVGQLLGRRPRPPARPGGPRRRGRRAGRPARC